MATKEQRENAPPRAPQQRDKAKWAKFTEACASVWRSLGDDAQKAMFIQGNVGLPRAQALEQLGLLSHDESKRLTDGVYNTIDKATLSANPWRSWNWEKP